MGRVRTDNEDRSLARPPVFAVADGMGGHQAGEVAADLAIACLDDTGRPGQTPDGRLLVGSIQRANAAIRLEARTRPELLGMGTTCTVLVVGEVVTIAHVGDSRAYRLRAGRLARLTEDHSLVAAMVRDGRLDPAAAATDARRHVITRALGADDDVAVDLVTVDRLPGDRFLLCSDGIHGQVDDGTIERVLADATDTGAAADRLIELAAAAGGEDNATVIVIDADGVAAPGVDVPAADKPVATPAPRSRRDTAGRRALVAMVAAIIVAAAVWLASGGAGPGGPSPTVAAPSVATSPVAPSLPGPTGPPSPASPSAPEPSTAAPGPSAASPS